jgi:hypothetical protein
MAKRNGGIIGPANTPTSSVAAGVWRLRDAFNSIKNETWPLVRSVATNSLRFNSGSSDYLNRTPASATNQKTFTISAWVKLSSLSNVTNGGIFNAYISGTQVTTFLFYSDQLMFYHYDGAFLIDLRSTQLFRDTSAWYHVMASVDTTQATSTNRVKLYVNGSQITSFSSSTYGSQNQNTFINSTVSHTIGRETPSQSYIGGYVSEFNFVDGQQLTPSSFGASNSSGVWYPIAYQGTYGTNGFYLKFANSASLGTDSSGNANTWTVNNLTSVDQSTDTELNNFNTLNPLIPLGSNFSAPTEGNLSLSQSGTGNSGFYASTIIPSAGKWYFEVKATAVSSSDRTNIGIANFESVTGTNSIENGDYKGISVSTGTTGRISVTNGATTTEFDVAGYVPVANDIMIFAVDMDNSRVYIGKNGTWFTTAAASGGNPATSTGYFSPVLGNGFAVGAGHGAGVSASATNLFNFGSPPYSANGYTDGAGYGNFSYAVPSGYYALCTKNLNTYG